MFPPVELLEQLHKNVTANQIENFKVLQDQQAYLIEWKNEEFKTLKKLKDSQVDVVNQMEKIRGTQSKSADQIQLIYETLILLQNQTEAVILKYSYLVQNYASNMHDQLTQLAIRQENEVDFIVNNVVSGLKSTSENIEEMILVQRKAIESWSYSKVYTITSKLTFTYISTLLFFLGSSG